MATQRRETALQRRMRMIECKREWMRRKREGLPTKGVFAAWPDLPEDVPPPVQRAATRPPRLQGKTTLAWLEQTAARADLPESVRCVVERKILRRVWEREYRRQQRQANRAAKQTGRAAA